MPTIWGTLDRVDNDPRGIRLVQVMAILAGRTTIRIRALVGKQTLIARGIERVDLSSLGAGEPVEISYHYDRGGFMEAETIYVLPQRAAIG